MEMKNICYESTKECNLNCDYCISADNAESVKPIIPYKDIIDIIAKCQPKRIVVSGGEPMLDRELLDKLNYIKEKCPDSFISLSTNGTGKNYDFINLQNKVDCIDFSIPALNREVYTQMRGVDLVDTVKENIKKAIVIIPEIRISYTLTKVNKQELQGILKFAEEVKASEVRIGRFFPFRDAVRCKGKYELSNDEINDILEQVKEKNYPFRIVPPIKDMDIMEKGYLTVNYVGEIFLPTSGGRKVLAEIGKIKDEEIINLVKEGEQENIFISTNMRTAKNYIGEILEPKRIRVSSKGGSRSAIEEFYSDRSRILYSQAFRRLQQKAQVFSLETNSSVHSRLTHSLEVSDVGRRIAKKIVEKMRVSLNPYCIGNQQNEELGEQIIAIVENACLLHDLGNPPFGHFGEAAIQKWWNENYKRYIKAYNKRARQYGEKAIFFTTKYQKLLLKDFEEFDGNPQGIRIMLRFRRDEIVGNFGINGDMLDCESGMNLTYQTILSCIKYVRGAGEKVEGVDEKLQKKAGYFQSEKRLIEKMYRDLKLESSKRFPFVYIMEAADDISYCLSDVADSIEKGLTTLKEFTVDFREVWKELYQEELSDVGVIINVDKQKKIDSGEAKDVNYTLATEWADNLTNIAVERFMEKIEGFVKGKETELLPHMNDANSDDEIIACKLMECLGEYARRKMYSTTEAESIEIAGYTIIKGILDNYGCLLTLTKEEFEYLIEEKNNPKTKKLDVESRYLHRIGEKYVQSYKNQKRNGRNYRKKI